MSEEYRLRLSQLLVPLAGYVAATAFTANQVNPEAAAEGAYLALVACVVLLPVAAIATRPDSELALGTLGSLALVALFPVGSGRAAAHGLLLVAVVTIALLRRGVRERSVWPVAFGGGLAIHLLFRADVLLAPQLEPASLSNLLVLPLLAGAAAAVLTRLQPPAAVASAAAIALLLGGGWSPAATLALLALAAGAWAARPGAAGLWRWLPLIAVAAAATLVSDRALALPLLLCGACLAAGRRAAWQGGIAAAGIAAALVLPPARGWTESLEVLPLLLVLLPAALFSRRSQLPRLLAAAVLGVAAQRLIPGPEAATAPLALAALAITTTGAAARLQGAWSGYLLAAAALTAGYPWLRPAPLPAALDLIGASARWPSALAVAAVLALLTSTARLAARRGGGKAATEPLYLALGLLVLAALVQIPAGVGTVGPLPALLTAENPRIALDLNRDSVAQRLVADSYLTNAAALSVGTPVAIVRVVGDRGTSAEWTLHAGVDTGEWAARRPDVAALPGVTVPDAWLSWVTRDGRLFAQRYRATTTLAKPLQTSRLEVERVAELPASVHVAIFHLEVRPPGDR